MPNCKICEHATLLFQRDKSDRFTATYTPTGYVRCAGPRYKGRAYFCRDQREACGDFKEAGRRGNGTE